jgi:hypothetical protein
MWCEENQRLREQFQFDSENYGSSSVNWIKIVWVPPNLTFSNELQFNNSVFFKSIHVNPPKLNKKSLWFLSKKYKKKKLLITSKLFASSSIGLFSLPLSYDDLKIGEEEALILKVITNLIYHRGFSLRNPQKSRHLSFSRNLCRLKVLWREFNNIHKVFGHNQSREQEEDWREA